MSVEYVSISLRAWHPSGDHVPGSAFIEKLAVEPSDAVKKATGPGIPRIELVSLAMSDYSREDTPNEAFAAALNDALLKAAKWLAKQSPEVFAALRHAGVVTEV